MTEIKLPDHYNGLEIAVIGMSGRFPKSRNIKEFWQNLVDGKECVSFFTDEEMRADGVSEEALNYRNYVKSWGWLDDIDMFDAAFFGYTPSEAELMDPQMRIFHECIWDALENAGYNPFAYKKMIGLYAGASSNLSWQVRVELAGKTDVVNRFAAKQLTDKDFLATRLAYRLNLKGPAVTMDTACSTSLVAIHLACQGLIAGDCDIALAGGSSISALEKIGYHYFEGMITSPDGHCRAFDARAKGSNFGNAVAAVVLKRLEDAVRDRDTIHAVVRGSAMNNDGSRKAAYTAPSIEGQSDAIKTALKMAGVEPGTIGYVETHGTGTTLGDPVEIEGLKAAFNTREKHFCRIGSVKTNMGHLEVCAGVTSFIKAVLILKNHLVPPSLFYEKPNPAIDFENSPFVVNTRLTRWQHSGKDYPRRAGVSSFGIGGTNAHIVLEEWEGSDPGGSPDEKGEDDTDSHYRLLLLSARSPSTLESMTRNLAAYFQENPGIDLADAAYTLHVGRRVFPYRRMAVCDSIPEAISHLSSPTSARVKTYFSQEDSPRILLMFPGLGSQYIDMGLDLYRHESFFREHIDRCSRIVQPLLGYELKDILYPGLKAGDSIAPGETALRDPLAAQVALFMVEVGLARLLMHWGIKPDGLIGYSFGEYSAACVGGVFSLEEGLRVVVERGRLVESMTAGAMTSVPLERPEVEALLKEYQALSLAIDNGESCIVSGPVPEIEKLESALKARRTMGVRVAVNRALHSWMVESVEEKFKQVWAGVKFNQPGIPLVSNVTGRWVSGETVMNAGYWARQMKGTVEFSQGLQALVAGTKGIFLELGPGRDLGVLLKRYTTEKTGGHQVLSLLRAGGKAISDEDFLLRQLGKLWLNGVSIDWDAVHQGQARTRIALPGYAFERKRYWLEKGGEKVDRIRKAGPVSGSGKKAGRAFYLPTWQRLVPAGETVKEPGEKPDLWVIFRDGTELSRLLAGNLETAGHRVWQVGRGPGFKKIGPAEFLLDEQEAAGYDRLMEEIAAGTKTGVRLLYLWGLGQGREENKELLSETIARQEEVCFYALLHLGRALARKKIRPGVRLDVVTGNAYEVLGGDGLYPGKALAAGAVGVIAQEFREIETRHIDLDLRPGMTDRDGWSHLAGRLAGRLATGEYRGQSEALRGNYSWRMEYDEISPDSLATGESLLQSGGVYLVTGGLGALGMMFSGYLAREWQARLVLVGRRGLAAGDRGPGGPEEEREREEKLRWVEELERVGGKVAVYGVDITDKTGMEKMLREVEGKWGRINGVIHCAGQADGEMIQLRKKARSEEVLGPKVKGTAVLAELFQGKGIDFMVLCSSVAAVLPQMGQVAYVAANAFLDAFCGSAGNLGLDLGRVIAIDWDRWQKVGMAVIAENQHRKLSGQELTGGISREEGLAAFKQVMTGGAISRLLVADRSFKEIAVRIRQGKAQEKGETDFAIPVIDDREQATEARPDLDTDYVAPGDENEEKLARMWSGIFGFKNIGVKDDFFDLGGDSLRAVMMLLKLQRDFNIEVPITDFFNNPTIVNLATAIRGGRGEDVLSTIELAEKKEYYALSSAQKRLYILQQVDPASVGYNEFFFVPLKIDYEIEKLERLAWDLIGRHECLRTSFHLVGLEPVQVIAPQEEISFSIEYLELQPAADGTGEQTIDSAIWKFIRPFDLSRPPLFRVGIFKIGERGSLLVLDMHHIITDAYSIQIFINEFEIIGRGGTLPPLRLQYKDYAEWQNLPERREAAHKQEAFWLAQFADGVPVLHFPLDHKRALAPGQVGMVRSRVKAERIEKLRSLAKNWKSTLFMIYLAIYNVFLLKITGQEDIVIGTVTAGRAHPDLENVIGMFVGTLVLRNRPRTDLTFAGLVQSVKDVSLKAFQNQDYQFDDLVDRLVTVREPGRNPLFDAAFVYDVRPKQSNLDDIPVDGIDKRLSNAQAKFDITYGVVEKEELLATTLSYDSHLFELGTIDRYYRYLDEIALVVADNPDIRLMDIAITHDLTQASGDVLKGEVGDFGF